MHLATFRLYSNANRLGGLLVLLLPCALLSGCVSKKPEVPPPPPLKVEVSPAVTRTVTDYEIFPGRTDAVRTVDVKARVTGFLHASYIKEGAEVRGDDRLNGGVRLLGQMAAPTSQRWV